MIHKKVIFQGEVYWLHESDTNRGFLLSPLDHYSNSGNLLVDPFTALSYAVVVKDEILRYGETIGSMADLKDVEIQEN